MARERMGVGVKVNRVNGVNALSMFERIRDIGELNQLIRLYLTHEIRRDHVAADTEFQHIMNWAEYMREQDYGRYETPSERRGPRACHGSIWARQSDTIDLAATGTRWR